MAPYLKAEGEGRREFDLVIIATPPASVVSALKAEFAKNSKSIFIDVCSVKTNLIQEIDALPVLAEQFVGTHPMAGREVSGTSSAQADLFSIDMIANKDHFKFIFKMQLRRFKLLQ